MFLKRALKLGHDRVLALDQRDDPISNLLRVGDARLLNVVVLVAEVLELFFKAALAANDVDRHRRENWSEDPEVDQRIYKLRRHRIRVARRSVSEISEVFLLLEVPATVARQALPRRLTASGPSARRAIVLVDPAVIADERLATFLMEGDEIALASDGAPTDGADEHRPHFAASSPRMPASSWRNALVKDAASLASFNTPPVSSAIF